MKFVLRDDDTCALTKVSEIIDCYRSIIKRIPINLSITPFRIPGPLFNLSDNKRLNVFPLERNKELVEFLRIGIHQGWIDVALHGYHHVVERSTWILEDKREMPWWREYKYGSNLDKKTRLGKMYLENLFDYEITTFVPPGNNISMQGLKAIINQKMNLIGTQGLKLFLKNISFDPLIYLNAIKRLNWRIKHPKYPKHPFVMKYFNGHKEISFYLLYPSTDLSELKKEIDFVHSVNGVFILSTHYHAFKKSIRSGETIEYAFHDIIDYITRKDNIEYITYKELWK